MSAAAAPQANDRAKSQPLAQQIQSLELRLQARRQTMAQHQRALVQTARAQLSSPWWLLGAAAAGAILATRFPASRPCQPEAPAPAAAGATSASTQKTLQAAMGLLQTLLQVWAQTRREEPGSP